MGRYLIGIDLGTTTLKVGIFTPSGKIISAANIPTPVHRDKQGYFYYAPEQLWTSAVNLVRKTVRKLKNPDGIVALSIASMGEAGVLINKSGTPVYPVITWFDRRTVPQNVWWEEKVGADKIFKITGLALNYIYGINKIMWLRTHYPALYRTGYKWLSLPDYFIYRLTDEIVTDYTIASRTMLLDLLNLRWSEKILTWADLDDKLLPPVYPSGTVVGTLRPEIARQMGLSTRTRIVLGGHDHVCATFATGLISPGEILDSQGTAETVIALVSTPELSTKIYRTKLSYGIHVSQKCRYYIKTGFYAYGESIEWYIRNFILPFNPGRNSSFYYRVMTKLAQRSPAGANGLFFVPYLRGSCAPYRDKFSRGIWMGLTTEHNLSDLTRSVFEGVSYQSKQMVELIKNVTNLKPTRIYAIGGPTKNLWWMKIKAAVYGTKLIIPQIPDTACCGAAILAGLGAGLYRTEQEAINQTRRSFQTIVPENKMVTLYATAYLKYIQIYPQTRNLLQTLY